jgi:hypothetical protein
MPAPFPHPTPGLVRLWSHHGGVMVPFPHLLVRRLQAARAGHARPQVGTHVCHAGMALVLLQDAWTWHLWAREARCTEALVRLPDHTKTAQTRRPMSVIVPSAPVGPATFCTVQQLRACFTWLLVTHVQVATDDWVFHNSIRPAQWPSAALAARFKKLLARYDPHDGETVHGIRGGIMQHAYASAAGVPVLEITQQAALVTPEVCARYLDVGRHLQRSVTLLLCHAH